MQAPRVAFLSGARGGIGSAIARRLAAEGCCVVLASRSLERWSERVALAETLGAKVVSDLKIGCGFPTDHPLHAGAPASNALAPEAVDAIKAADVILSLDWVDLGGGLRHALGAEPPKARIINVSADFHIHNGWSMDYEMLPPVDLLLAATPDAEAAS